MKRTEYFTCSGTPRIAYSIAGDGPLLIFLHGIGGNKRNWLPQFETFAEQFTCVAWDARGYGDSDDDPPLTTFSDFAQDLAALIVHLDRGPAHIVGLSMGGMIALDLVARRPDLVASLVLASSAAGFGPSTKEVRDEFLARRLTPLQAGASVRDIAPAMMEVLITEQADDDVRAAVFDSIVRLRAAPYMRTLKAFVTTEFSATLTDIDKPTLVLVGAEDLVLPPARSEALAEGIRDSQLVVIPACGHLSNIECAAVFNDHVKQFLFNLALTTSSTSFRTANQIKG